KTATETLEKPAEEAKQDKDEALDNEINKLTREVDETLNLSKWHTERARGEHLHSRKSGEDSRNELVNQASASEVTESGGTGPNEEKESKLRHVHVTETNAESSSGPANEALDREKTEDAAVAGGDTKK
ncbi:hypothetical protein KC336_g20614, partial [Hortaea werneckii]